MGDSHSVTAIFVSWFPMLLLIAVWLFFFRKFGNRSPYQQYHQQQLDELRKQNTLLERIASALERRP